MYLYIYMTVCIRKKDKTMKHREAKRIQTLTTDKLSNLKSTTKRI